MVVTSAGGHAGDGVTQERNDSPSCEMDGAGPPHCACAGQPKWFPSGPQSHVAQRPEQRHLRNRDVGARARIANSLSHVINGRFRFDRTSAGVDFHPGPAISCPSWLPGSPGAGLAGRGGNSIPCHQAGRAALCSTIVRPGQPAIRRWILHQLAEWFSSRRRGLARPRPWRRGAPRCHPAPNGTRASSRLFGL